MDTYQLTQREYLVITDYEKGVISWSDEVLAAYDRLYAAFDFGVACPEGIPEAWYNRQLEWYQVDRWTIYEEQRLSSDEDIVEEGPGLDDELRSNTS